MPMPSNGAEITLLKGCAVAIFVVVAFAVLVGGLIAKAVL